MSKRMVLVGILILLVCSALAAATELKIDLEVQLKEKPAIGDKFNVHIFATPSESTQLGQTKIKLKVSDTSVASFTGSGTSSMSNLGPAEYTNGLLFLKAGSLGLSLVTLSGRTYLGSLEMKINRDGVFSVEVAPTESSAVSDLSPLTYHSIFVSNELAVKRVMLVSTTVPLCVPKTWQQCPGPDSSSACGSIDDGCGGMVACSSSCATGSVCVANKCETAVSQLPTVFDRVACQAVVDVPAPSDKALLTKLAVILQDWGKSCTINSDCKAGYSCTNNACTATELSILSPIFSAVKDWLTIKFPS